MSAADREMHADYTSAVAYLLDRINYEKVAQSSYGRKDFRLGRMRALLASIGDPHLDYPIVHIAGTKGKGSVAWFIAEILRQSGKRVGLYTSPHLLKLEERFVVDAAPCSQLELVECVREIRPAAERIEAAGGGRATFFELTTAIGFLLFSKRAVEVGVIEVGMGGRLDCTNVCAPTVSVITSISFDHEEQLGRTLEAIATEKAGIIKHDIPVVSGVRTAEAARVITRTAADRSCELRQIGIDFDVHTAARFEGAEAGIAAEEKSRFDYWINNRRWPHSRSRPGLSLRMLGEHQKDNAAVAIAAIDLTCERLGWKIDDRTISAALSHTQVPARMQLFPGAPSVLVDAGHNVASIDAFATYLGASTDSRGTGGRIERTVILAASSDKDYPAIVRRLLDVSDLLIVTQYHLNPRSVDWNQLYATAVGLQEAAAAAGSPARTQLAKAPDIAAALDIANASTDPAGLICVTGSFLLAAEVLPLLGVLDALSNAAGG